VAHVAALDQESLGLRQSAGKHGPGGQDILHAPPQRRLAQTSRQPVGDGEAAVGLFDLARLDGSSSPEEVGLGDESGVGDIFNRRHQLRGVDETLLQQIRHTGGEIPGEQDPIQGLRVFKSPSEGQRFVAQREAASPVPAERQLDRQRGQETGLGSVPIAHRGDSGLQHRHYLVIDPTDGGRQAPSGIGERRSGEGLDVALFPGTFRRLEQGLPVSRIAGAPLGLSQGQEELQVPGGVVWPYVDPEEFKCLPVVPDRFIVGELRQCPVAGPGGIVHGSSRLGPGRSRSRPVMSKGGKVVIEVPGVESFQRLGHPAMQCSPTGRGQLLIERRPHQRVGEAIPGDQARYFDEEPGIRRVLQRGEDRLVIETPGELDDGGFEFKSYH
jgi:hypothetical protein